MNEQEVKSNMIYNNLVFDQNDLIGKKIEIASSSNKYNQNKSGTFIFESKNMIFLIPGRRSNNCIKKVSKKEIDLIKVYSRDGVYFISGQTLKGRPEERISKIK